MSTFSEDTQYRVWENISDALTYIHARNILHCDIKPENIVLGEKDRGAVLCDFGCSGWESSAGNGGTPCYLPPEFLMDESKRSFPDDIWAFGVTMLYVHRRIPLPCGNWKIADIHTDQSVQKMMRKWLLEIEEVQERLPERLSLLRNMLQQDPFYRIKASSLHKEVQDLKSTASRPLALMTR